MPIVLFILALLALWAFIRWDDHRLDREAHKLDRESFLRQGSRNNLKWKGLLGGSMFMAIASIQQFFSPSHPPFSGRGAFISKLAYDVLGPFGIAIVFLTIGIILGSSAYSEMKNAQKRKP